MYESDDINVSIKYGLPFGDQSMEDLDSWLMHRTQQEVTIFDEWRCQECGSEDPADLEETDAFHVCRNCGVVQKSLGLVVRDPVPDDDVDQGCQVSYYAKIKKDKEGNTIRPKYSYGTELRHRYKRPFYYRERLNQWLCQESPLSNAVLKRFEELLESGEYGSRRQVSRGTVYQMCKDHKLCKYKENWKTIVYHLRQKSPPQIKTELVDYCSIMFDRISKRFDGITQREMALYLKGSKGKPRHHMLHVNYVHRKILEVRGITEYHREFPLLRTPSKVHALDDVMQIIARQTNMPFTRTPVVVIPKIKHRKKR